MHLVEMKPFFTSVPFPVHFPVQKLYSRLFKTYNEVTCSYSLNCFQVYIKLPPSPLLKVLPSEKAIKSLINDLNLIIWNLAEEIETFKRFHDLIKVEYSTNFLESFSRKSHQNNFHEDIINVFFLNPRIYWESHWCSKSRHHSSRLLIALKLVIHSWLCLSSSNKCNVTEQG